VRGFSTNLARLSGFPVEIGSGSFWVGANGLVIEVGFGVMEFRLWNFEIHYRLVKVHPLFVLIV